MILSAGPTVCSAEQRTFCVTLALCIPTEMVCDGFHNCPLAGDDEDPDKCDAMPLKMALSSEEGQQDPRRVLGFLSKAVLNTFGKDRSKDGTTTPPPENKRHSGFELTKGMLRDMSDLLLKQLLSRHRSGNTSLAANSSTSTTTARPPWKDVQTGQSSRDAQNIDGDMMIILVMVLMLMILMMAMILLILVMIILVMIILVILVIKVMRW